MSPFAGSRKYTDHTGAPRPVTFDQSTYAKASVDTRRPPPEAFGVGWRATVDEDGQYCFAVGL
jgi:hypothetical protein